ncbi:SDR family NAD(P)-dependent oxidoreductase [Brevibacillus nitrificans]|uniref:SDR family NAD(P)-dependent oxidoreductase n=1 Tax=Brevibacillus nitrificans TaxID=651560 RepID=UPI00262D5C8C|nr:SDR family oxidoreductase [Brevibacillus nitrificans]MED1795612.1 SDR family oxidoreductase [Brevibacillus nitrificans]
MTQGHVLLTGASSGIGWELAQLFAQDGYSLIVVARRADKLQELKSKCEAYGVDVHVIAKDLAQPHQVEELYEEVTRQQLAVDILVNNAGFGSYGLFQDSKEQEDLEMIQVNITALTRLTRLFLPEMVARRRGRILNVASIAGFLSGPLMAVYYATKAYVLSFSEALENELRGSGVTVTALCPGATATGFEERASLQDSRLFRGGVMDVKTVARIGYQGLMQGQTLVIPGWKNRLLTFSVRLAPRKLVTAIARRVQSKM